MTWTGPSVTWNLARCGPGKIYLEAGAKLTCYVFISDPHSFDSFNLTLDGTLEFQDMRSIGNSFSSVPETQEAAWQWMTSNYDKSVAKQGKMIYRFLTSM